MVKTAISIPDEVFEQVDERARELQISRSEFFRRAAERWLSELDSNALTAEIDAALADMEPDGNEEFLRAAARRLTEDQGE